MSKSNDDFIPTAAEKNRLQRCGFGYPSVQLSNQDRYPVKTAIEAGSLEDLEDNIVDLYPNLSLRLSGFGYAKADKGRRLKILHPTTAVELRNLIGQGKLFLIPRRDLRVPSNDDSNAIVQGGEQPAPGPVAAPESPIGFLNPPSRELEEDQPIVSIRYTTD
ncbi:uncharacterized protein LOC117345381 [Pecten maximus]|uniref:uncharacterized protein LOC117345381 n=1 Tax=Pecten maximus TaxID=6579 RepID=UPI0014586C17|nr:uncharacterized protein LOC117345381 [Pecten maximus]